MEEMATVEIAGAEPGVRIRFTLDGTEAVPAAARRYEGPFEVRRCTVIRAVAFSQTSEPSSRRQLSV